jgi:hypothetical protein
MEAPLEIRYAGVVIGRAQEVRSADGDDLSFFIPVRDPMPVGTVLRLRSGDQETPVRVVRAVEAADAAVCGMQVKNIGEAEEVALEFIPPPATAAEKVKATAPTPAVDAARMRSESAQAEVAPLETSPAPSAVAAPAPAPTGKAAEEPLGAFAPGPAGEAAAVAEAVPAAAVAEAVPVAVASSMTGALRNATESVSPSMPTSESPTTADVQASEPASPKPDSASARNATLAYGSVAVPKAEAQAEDRSAAAASNPPTGEDLPPARPISGPNGRRKTKRRK